MTLQQTLPPGKYKLTIDDFLRLDETGVFGTNRTELLDGEIIIMNAEYRPHGRIKDELYYQLRRALDSLQTDLFPLGASMALPDHSMPLPDIALTREPRGAGPIPFGSVALVIEVSASTLQRDMHEKTAIYARALIPEYWIVEVEARVVHRLWSPMGATYLHRDKIGFGARLTSATIQELSIDTSAL